MGCLQSKKHGKKDTEESHQEPKQYSWDVRKTIDPSDFTIENLKGETVGRIPGSVNGMQFIIQNCEDCNIYIYDHTAQVSVDDCVNCRIFVGPIKGSVFIRDCKDCKFMLACQQYRTRDCQKIESFLCCVSQPIIEASTGMKFGCYQYNYPELEGQFKAAGLSVYNNNWSNIHDFTPVPEQNNYSYVAQDLDIQESIPLPTTEQFTSIPASCSPQTSVVPKTHGKRRKIAEEGCLVVFFCDEQVHERAKTFMARLKEHNSGCVLVQSKEIIMQPGEAKRVFGSENYSVAVSQGPVIAFEYNGDGCIQSCQDTLAEVSKETTGLAFVSSNPQSAQEQIDNFYNFADMQMNA